MVPDDENIPLMGDLTGLGKVADSKLVNRVYDEVLSGTGREIGTALTHIAKTFRLLFAPFQLAAHLQDRLDKWYREITRAIPEEQQIEAPANIAGPVLQNLVFLEEDNPLSRLYIEILKRAVDKERCQEAHPAFVKIIEQLSPDEALMLLLLRRCPAGIKRVQNQTQIDFPKQQLAVPNNWFIYFSHLDSLGLIDLPLKPGRIQSGVQVVKLTLFGEAFAKAVIPEDFDILKDATANE